MAFERRSETLLHHIFRQEPTGVDVLSVAQKLASAAIQRLGPVAFQKPVYYLGLPVETPRVAWSEELRWLFEKNLPPEMRAPASDSGDDAPRCPDGCSLDTETRLLRGKVQGHKFTTRYDAWLPIDYEVQCSIPELYCDNEEGHNDVHFLLARAARSVRKALEKQATLDAPGTLPPTWKGLSRARWRTGSGS